MPRGLRRQLEKHIHLMVVDVAATKPSASDGHIVLIAGHIKGRPKHSTFKVKHSSYQDGFHASVTCDDTEHGRRAARRFNGAFGPGSEEPKLIHTGKGGVVHEYWSDRLHPVLAPLREGFARIDGRRITQKNY